MGLLNRTPPPLIGLDISTTAVKLLGLAGGDGKYRVESYAVSPLPAEAMVERSIANPEMVADAVSKAVAKARTKVNHAAIAVSGSSVITKVITMPNDLSEAELAAQITLEADQYIPYSLDEVFLDFQVLGQSHGNAETVDVLLAASRSDTVDQRVQAVEMAGLTVNVVDIEAYAMETAYELVAAQVPESVRQGNVAIIDVGATATTLNVLNAGKTIFTREQQFGGKQLTEEIQHRYGLTFEEAGLAKKTGELPDDYQTEVLEPFEALVAQQVSRLLQIFFSSTGNTATGQLILCGGCANLPGITDVVSTQIGVPAIVANPLADMAIGKGVNADALRQDSTTLMIACGLALRTFDHASR